MTFLETANVPDNVLGSSYFFKSYVRYRLMRRKKHKVVVEGYNKVAVRAVYSCFVVLFYTVRTIDVYDLSFCD